MNPLRIAFIYREGQKFLSGNYKDNTFYHFFFSALQRCEDVQIRYFKSQRVFNASVLKGSCDVVILFDVIDWGAPELILNLDKLKVPIVLNCGDCHQADYRPSRCNGKLRPELAKKYGVTHCFFQHAPEYFYKFWPKEFEYYQLFFGVEKELYENLQPFANRRKEVILNSGELRVQGNFYVLRRLVNQLPFVSKPIFNKNNVGNSTGDNFNNLLQKYRASVAACTTCTVMKYIEIPAAGCLTFMEVTNQNNADKLGFIDNETCIYINEQNYEDKMRLYMSTIDDPIWEMIAEEGRKFILKNYTNDIQAIRFVNWLRTII